MDNNPYFTDCQVNSFLKDDVDFEWVGKAYGIIILPLTCELK